jgi:hypothetical protein
MLNQKFALSQIKNSQIFCNSHPVSPHWLPIGKPDDQTNYQCAKCKPPPAKAFVAKWHDHGAVDSRTHDHARASTIQEAAPAPHLAATSPEPSSPIIVAYERAVCPACRCSWVVELDLRSGITLRCYTCKRELIQQQIDHELSQPSNTTTKRLTPFQAGSVEIIPHSNNATAQGVWIE